MPLTTYKHVSPHSDLNQDGIPTDLKPSNMRITAYGGHTVMQYGICKLSLTHRGTSELSTFHVVKSGGPAIIRLPTCRMLKLVTLNYSIDVFDGIGCFEGEYHVTLDPTVPPVVNSPRRVPLALSEPLRDELQALIQLDIIAKVDRPTDWANSRVCVCVCVCVSPNQMERFDYVGIQDLNKAIKKPYHFTPTLDDVLPKLNGAKFFTILDARSGYWNIKLDEESSYHNTGDIDSGDYHSVSTVPRMYSKRRWMKHSATSQVSLAYRTTSSLWGLKRTAATMTQTWQQCWNELAQQVFASTTKRWSSDASAYRSSGTSSVPRASNQTQQK